MIPCHEGGEGACQVEAGLEPTHVDEPWERGCGGADGVHARGVFGARDGEVEARDAHDEHATPRKGLPRPCAARQHAIEGGNDEGRQGGNEHEVPKARTGGAHSHCVGFAEEERDNDEEAEPQEAEEAEGTGGAF